MSNFFPLGPKRPIKKPKPCIIELIDGNVAFTDAEDGFQEGIEIFVCLEEDPAQYGLLESGTYTLASGGDFAVIDGVIDEIL